VLTAKAQNVWCCFCWLILWNVFEGKMYRSILGPVYDHEKENWRILTNKEIFASVKKNLL